MSNATSYVIQVKHYFHSFKGNPCTIFDRIKSSYFEVGRI